MSQLRILTDNAADRATLTVADTAAGMGADRLKTDIKGDACRVLADTAQIVATWPQTETLGAMVIPASNLGPSSTVRVRGYSDEAGTILVYDSNVIYAASGSILENYSFDQPLNVNQFAFGFPPSTAVYPDEQLSVQRVVIDLDNAENGEGFIDITRLIIGPVINCADNGSYGQTDGLEDLTENTRSSSGDLKSDLGPKSKTLMFSMSYIDMNERAKIKRILDRGIGHFIWVSLMSGDEDPELERDKSIYGKLGQSQSMQWNNYFDHSAQFEIKGF